MSEKCCCGVTFRMMPLGNTLTEVHKCVFAWSDLGHCGDEEDKRACLCKKR